MNKTVTVNIAGIIFNIEEEAYLILSNYLDSIRSKFHDENERDEILKDIEARIAELFQNKIHPSKEVIINEDVEEIISIMGSPEDYVDEEENQKSQEYSTEKTRTRRKRKLFRDVDNGLLTGVCSGFAAYLGIDVLIVRIAFVIFGIAGSGIIAYFVLMFVLPEAKSASDKLKMKGEKINIENIKQTFHSSKEEFKKRRYKAKEKARKVANDGAGAMRKIFKVFGKIFGFGLIAFAITVSIVIFSLFMGDSGLIYLYGDGTFISFTEFIGIVFQNNFQGNLMTAGLCLIIGIPILGALFIGTKLLLGIRGSIKGFSVAAACTWIIGGILCAVVGLQLGLEFKNEGTVDYNVELANNNLDTLYLDVADDLHFSNNISYEHGRRFELLKVADKDIYFGYPTLEIRKSTTDTNFTVQLVKESRGATLKQAIFRAENLKYKVKSTSDKLVLDPYFKSAADQKWRAQTTKVIVWVPVGKTVHLSKNLDRIMSQSDDVMLINDSKRIDQFWTMTKESSNCIGCDQSRLYSILTKTKPILEPKIGHH
jgi:phage shock protein PspC (stress-responsive transcriptional regulator)